MGASLEKMRTGALHTPTCTAMRECSGPYGWTIEQVRESIAHRRDVTTSGSFVLDRDQFARLFTFLRSPNEDDENMDKSAIIATETIATNNTNGTDTKTNSAGVNSSKLATHTRTSSSSSLSSSSSSLPFAYKKTKKKKKKKKKTPREMSKKKNKTKTSEAASTSTTGITSTTSTTTPMTTKSTSQIHPCSHFVGRVRTVDPDPMDIIFNHLRQRHSALSRAGECSYFVAATALALCARSRMELRLHFLYDLFHAEGGYGIAHTPSDMEFGGKLMTIQEIVFMAWTTLRALCALSYGHVDHVHLSINEVKQSCMQLVRLMESNNRRFNHRHGFSWLEFEKLIHSYVFSGAAWIYALIDDCSFTMDKKKPGQVKKKNKNKSARMLSGKRNIGKRTGREDPYGVSSSRQNADDSDESDEEEGGDSEEKQKFGSRAQKFRDNSKGQIAVDVISLASSDFKATGGAANEATSASGAMGGTAFMVVLRPMLGGVQQTASRSSKPRALDGAGIISWNSRLFFTDTGEGTEAAAEALPYGFDIELRVGGTVCGGCFVDMCKLMDGGRFGMQVQMRSVRGKRGWGGGRIGNLRLAAEHIPR